MLEHKSFEDYMVEVHTTAAEINDVLDGVEPAIQTAALTKIMGGLLFSAVKAGVFTSIDEAMHHYADGVRAMFDDLNKHFNRTQQ